MTLLVRDEEDIIQANIDYHLAQGVDFFIITDNLSIDRTSEILENYTSSGKFWIIREHSDDYNQGMWVTRMARLAADHGADWVINSDADEFWWPIHGNLKTCFEQIPPEVGVVEVQRHNFACILGDDPFWSRMIWREKISRNSKGQLLPSKVAHRSSACVEVKQGNHAVSGVEPDEIGKAPLEILHFPLRNPSQFINKIRNGGAAYQRNAVLGSNVGGTWRQLYEELERHGNLDTYLAASIHDPQRLTNRLGTGELIPDRRLADFLLQLSPASQ
ncbi:MAG: glycosyltransferase family 2 protein [Prochlorococcaceae cyanobacterium]